MDEQTTPTGPEFTPEETSYFENRGEAAEPTQPALPLEQPETPAEQPAEAAATPAAEPKKQETTIPLTVLLEERAQTKELRERLRNTELEKERYLERFRLIEQMQQPAPSAPPSVKDDPFAYLENVPNELQAVKQELSAWKQQQQQANAQQQVLRSYAGDVEQFQTTTTDFKDAYKFVVEGRIAELKAIGHPDPVTGAQQDELAIVTHSLQQGRSPAETIYSVAKARGWQGKPNGSGGADKLATIQQGQDANRSLNAAGGTSGGAEVMTAEKLIAMPVREFEKWIEKNPAAAKRIMGG